MKNNLTSLSIVMVLAAIAVMTVGYFTSAETNMNGQGSEPEGTLGGINGPSADLAGQEGGSDEEDSGDTESGQGGGGESGDGNPVLNFWDMRYWKTEDEFLLFGYVYSTEEGQVLDLDNLVPIEDLDIWLVCADTAYPSSTSGSDGRFDLSGGCSGGEEAYAETVYYGKRYRSSRFEVPFEPSEVNNLRGSSQIISIHQATTSQGVPEFSAITMFLAVGLVTGSLIYLRRR